VETKQDFGEIVEQYTDFVYNVAYRMLKDPQEAEDATQEAFLAAYKAWDKFRGDAVVTTWLYRIATNACLMRIRKLKRSPLLSDTGYEEWEVPDWAENPERWTLNQELKNNLADGIRQLPADLRAAVVMRDVQGLENDEAAKALGISVSELKARLHRGRVILRKYLQDYIKAQGE
jgi:RNA polymerase sigma-70 factor (ECF subfamily)